jgi:hypothetical protein
MRSMDNKTGQAIIPQPTLGFETSMPTPSPGPSSANAPDKMATPTPVNPNLNH